MNPTEFPAPPTQPTFLEHEVANPDNANRLLEQIEDDTSLLDGLAGKHILSADHFDADLLLQVFRAAARFEKGRMPAGYIMTGKTMGVMFLDHARTQTRLSFNRAWQRLGGEFMNMERPASEILAERQAMDEVAELCNTFCDIAVIRTPEEAMFNGILEHMRVPVVNAGVGASENPTHGIADLYTILKWRPELFDKTVPEDQRLTIGIIGNPYNTRTIRGFLRTLAKFPHVVSRIVLLQHLAQPFKPGEREALEEAGLNIASIAEMPQGVTSYDNVKRLFPDLDMLYVHRWQGRPVPRREIAELKSLLKPDAMFLSPSIHIKEFSDMMNDSPHNGYFAQARGGVFIRMALLCAVMGRGGPP